MAAYCWVDDLISHLRADCLYTGSAPGPTLGHGKPLPFYLILLSSSCSFMSFPNFVLNAAFSHLSVILTQAFDTVIWQMNVDSSVLGIRVVSDVTDASSAHTSTCQSLPPGRRCSARLSSMIAVIPGDRSA